MTGDAGRRQRLPVELTLTLVEDAGDQGPVVYGFVRDISERRRGEEQLAYLAYHDPLTALPNRVLVEQQLDLALARARRAGSAVALMFVDLDDFKEVNDRLGHAAGDQLLAGVAARLRGVLRDSDVLARQGGDEFLVLLTDLTEDPAAAAEMVAAKLLGRCASRSWSAAPRSAPGPASASACTRPTPPTPRRCCAMPTPPCTGPRPPAAAAWPSTAPTRAHPRRTSVSAQLRQAMTHGELELHYQPIWRLGRGRGSTGVEALLRWRHPERGLLRPGAFMNLADQTPSATTSSTGCWPSPVARRGMAGQGLGPAHQPQHLPPPAAGRRFAERLTARWPTTPGPGRFVIELTESAWTVDAERDAGRGRRPARRRADGDRRLRRRLLIAVAAARSRLRRDQGRPPAARRRPGRPDRGRAPAGGRRPGRRLRAPRSSPRAWRPRSSSTSWPPTASRTRRATCSGTRAGAEITPLLRRRLLDRRAPTGERAPRRTAGDAPSC